MQNTEQFNFFVSLPKVTVGMPPNNEYTITAPLPESELRQLIHEVTSFVITINIVFYANLFLPLQNRLTGMMKVRQC